MAAQSQVMGSALHSDLGARLARLLEDIDARAGVDFSGIGLIVTASPAALPIIALRPTSVLSGVEDPAAALAGISHPWHEHHDGFHVLACDFQIQKIAQYFSPPIAAEARIDRKKRFGGRYLAALFGSALPDVLATGISSRDFGMAVFEGGEETIHRAARAMPEPAEKATE